MMFEDWTKSIHPRHDLSGTAIGLPIRQGVVWCHGGQWGGIYAWQSSHGAGLPTSCWFLQVLCKEGRPTMIIANHAYSVGQGVMTDEFPSS